jgi:transposase
MFPRRVVMYIRRAIEISLATSDSMSGYIQGVDRSQRTLFPEALDEFIGADHPIRAIDALVEQLPMERVGFGRAMPKDLGRPGYDPRALLKLFVYGYLNRVRSSRRLEREAQRNIEVMWLLRRLAPDHKTISDFRRMHPKALTAAFRQFTMVCRQAGLFGAELVGIDGTKVRAVNAKHQSFTPASLRALLRRIDRHIKDYLGELDTNDAVEAAQEKAAARSAPLGAPATAAPGTLLRAQLAQLQARQQEYQQLLATLEASGDTQVTRTDPESRRMKVKQGAEVCYNAQIAVDAQHHLLAAIEVTNEVTDVHQLAPMAEAAKAELGVSQLTVTADAGYHNGEQLARCAEGGITALVPRPQVSKNTRAGRFTKADFTYLPEENAYRCPANAILPHQFDSVSDGDVFHYYHNFAACAACPLRAQCTDTRSPRGGRRIKRWEQEYLVEDGEARLAVDPGARVQRKSLVEHPFGTIKRWDDASYFLVRGLEKVRGEFSLMALAYNFRRAVNVLGVPRLLTALHRASASTPAIALAETR